MDIPTSRDEMNDKFVGATMALSKNEKKPDQYKLWLIKKTEMNNYVKIYFLGKEEKIMHEGISY